VMVRRGQRLKHVIDGHQAARARQFSERRVRCKGSSPNPGGRPAASPAPQSSAFEVLVEKTLTVTDRTGTREIAIEEALQRQTYERALNGDRMAARDVLKWITKRDAWLAKNGPKASSPAIALRISPDPDNADAALLLLGIAAPNPARAEFGEDRAQLLLEPWAVQAALQRRRGGAGSTFEWLVTGDYETDLT
jgi:hypothetical protein